MERTLKREFKELEVVGREAIVIGEWGSVVVVYKGQIFVKFLLCFLRKIKRLYKRKSHQPISGTSK